MARSATIRNGSTSKALPTCARIVGSLYLGALWAMVVALALSEWTWFEMRVNVGLVMYGVWALLFVVLFLSTRKPHGPLFTIVNAVVCTAASIVLSRGFIGVQTIPACLVREGLMQPQWVIANINMALVAFLVVGLVLSVVLSVAARRPGAHAI